MKMSSDIAMEVGLITSLSAEKPSPLEAGLEATGPEGIPIHAIKELGQEVSLPLGIVFQNNILQGKVPIRIL